MRKSSSRRRRRSRPSGLRQALRRDRISARQRCPPVPSPPRDATDPAGGPSMLLTLEGRPRGRSSGKPIAPASSAGDAAPAIRWPSTDARSPGRQASCSIRLSAFASGSEFLQARQCDSLSRRGWPRTARPSRHSHGNTAIPAIGRAHVRPGCHARSERARPPGNRRR